MGVKYDVIVEETTVDSLIDAWKSDSFIDPSELGLEALKCEQVHDKYMKMLAQARRKYREAEAALKTLRMEKYQFYTQGTSRENIARGWKLPPSGKILKNEAWQYVDADQDVVALALAAGNAQDVVDAVYEKLKMIAFRGNRISDAIKWQLFVNGK